MSVAVQPRSWRGRIARPPLAVRLEAEVGAIWVLATGLVLYLAFDGGGYDIVVHSQVSILIWWVVLLGAAWGLLPAGRLTRAGLITLGLFGVFVAWTGIAATWSISTERSLADLSLVAGYLGVLALGLMVQVDRERGLRHTLLALSSAIVVVAILALISRLFPNLIPAAHQTASLVVGTQNRLAWPLNYWNALAALLVMGLPMLLAVAATARSRIGQALAAGAIPLIILCGYLTFSRGGAVVAVVAVVAYLALAPDRWPKLATVVASVAGGAILVASATDRPALELGLTTSAATHQGATLLVPLLLVCAGVGVAQLGISLVARHAILPRFLSPSGRQARLLLVGGLVVCVIAGMAAGVPHRLSHAWSDFKHPTAAALHDLSLGRYASASGNGRYDYWKAAVDATHGHVLGGSGPGTYQLLWLPRAPYFSYAQNAHSIYLETLAELGVVGLVLLVAFFALILGAAVRLVVRSQHEARTRAAAGATALLAFMISAGIDWDWQVPVLPVSFLLLAAAVLAPGRLDERSMGSGARWTLRGVAMLAGLACLVAIAVPLATTDAVRASQAADARGQLTTALRDAQQAARIEPGASSPQIQLALVQESKGLIPGAISAARLAARNEPANWTVWVILSRLEAEDGHAQAALADYHIARRLNPRSRLFPHASRS